MKRLMDLYSVDPDKRYLEYTDRWATYHKWTARGSVDDTNADNQCCEQTYIDRFAATGDSVMIAPTTENLNHQMATGRKDYWWWIDAIQMAMPVYAKYAKISGDRHYLDYAMDCYRDAVTVVDCSILPMVCGGATASIRHRTRSPTVRIATGVGATDGFMPHW